MAKKQRNTVDYGNIDTRGGARRTTQEEIDAARYRASGQSRVGYQPNRNPEFAAWAKGEAESRIRRSVMGLISNKGRQPMYTLSHAQFAEFQQTGAWSGEPRMPTPEEYGPHSYAPDDKEYT